MNTSDDTSRGRFDRREFLKGSGAAAAASAVATGNGLVAEAAPPRNRKIAPAGLQSITLNVNGRDQKVQVEPRMTLLEVLRYRLNLTGAKPVSPDGTSGASTVLLDGKPVSASTTMVMKCVGKRVRTVESLGGAHLDPVPAAFIKYDASQCGFCTPGFVVAVRAFLDKNPHATEEQIRSGLNGNICRCGTYANILPAVIELAKGGRDA